jgi:exonuclease SbcD
MLILVVGDIHSSGNPPVGRTDKDKFVSVQVQKLQEVVTIANDHNVPIVCPGDVFNSSNATYGVYNRAGRILRCLNNPFYFVFGNHDLLYHSLQQWKQTALGALWINNPMVKHISECEDADWSYCDWNVEPNHKPDTDLFISHQAIVTQKQMDENEWLIKDERGFALPWDDETFDPYRIVICGHWHTRYWVRDGERRLLNPGPVVRRDVTPDSFTKMPSVTLLNTDTGIAKQIFLKSARPGDEVLSRSHIRKKQTQSINNEKIMSFVKNLNMKGSSKFMAMLLAALDSGEMDEDMVEMIKELISKAKDKHKED